jgi:uncharacterized repeat protein (TIGR02543 family)
MKNQRFYSALAFIFAIFFLFTACNNFLKANDPANYYIVIFETDGGTPIPRPQIVAQGGEVTLPAPVTRYGYVFGGWYRETACINPWNFFTDTVSNDTTLYVKWNPKFYTVNFNTNGGSLAPDPQNIAYGNKVIMPPPISNTGYGFGGWYKEKACINQWNFDSGTISDNIILYDKWDIIYYTIDFNTNNGSPVPQQNVVHGGKITKPSVVNKTGYTFDGWYK